MGRCSLEMREGWNVETDNSNSKRSEDVIQETAGQVPPPCKGASLVSRSHCGPNIYQCMCHNMGFFTPDLTMRDLSQTMCHHSAL